MKIKNKNETSIKNKLSGLFLSIIKDQDTQIRNIAKFSVLFIYITAPLCGILFGIRGILVFILSALLMLINFSILKETVDLLISKYSSKKRNSAVLPKFLVLFLLLAICLYAIINIWKTEVIPLLLGISTLVAGIFCVSLKEFRRKK